MSATNLNIASALGSSNMERELAAADRAKEPLALSITTGEERVNETANKVSSMVPYIIIGLVGALIAGGAAYLGGASAQSIAIIAGGTASGALLVGLVDYAYCFFANRASSEDDKEHLKLTKTDEKLMDEMLLGRE